MYKNDFVTSIFQLVSEMFWMIRSFRVLSLFKTLTMRLVYITPCRLPSMPLSRTEACMHMKKDAINLIIKGIIFNNVKLTFAFPETMCKVTKPTVCRSLNTNYASL